MPQKQESPRTVNGKPTIQPVNKFRAVTDSFLSGLREQPISRILDIGGLSPASHLYNMMIKGEDPLTTMSPGVGQAGLWGLPGGAIRKSPTMRNQMNQAIDTAGDILSPQARKIMDSMYNQSKAMMAHVTPEEMAAGGKAYGQKVMSSIPPSPAPPAFDYKSRMRDLGMSERIDDAPVPQMVPGPRDVEQMIKRLGAARAGKR